MHDKCRQEMRGNFGWSVDGALAIRAFWLARAEFANPSDTVSGKIARSTAQVLKQKLTEHASEVTKHPNLEVGLLFGSVMAFAMSDELGGGYLIVSRTPLGNFEQIATEQAPRAAAAATERPPDTASNSVPGNAWLSSLLRTQAQEDVQRWHSDVISHARAGLALAAPQPICAAGPEPRNTTRK